ncbi:MAG: TerC family protein, partial [Planctomycetota bacterium]|nr:TerC family protein [Planctomycetota bacterium]
FVVFTSNIFAILGLRALYFLLAGLMGRLRFLKPALSLVLVFIGAKMILEEASKSEALGSWTARLPHISTSMSLAVIGSILGLAAALSILFPSKGAVPEDVRLRRTGPDDPDPLEDTAGRRDPPGAARDTGGTGT